MTKIATTISFEGPFFQRDPAKRFRQNVAKFMEQVAEVGESDVKAQLNAGMAGRSPISAGVSPSRVSAHVVGRTSNLNGKRWAVTAIVSVNNSGMSRRQGVALMAAASVLEGRYRAFRRTTNRLRKMEREAQKLLAGIE